MPQYKFRATDSFGNAVDGSLEATSEALAANQIGQMGYNLVQLEESPSVAQPTVEMPPMTPSGYPRRVDLTQATWESPVAVETGNTAKEPWERSVELAAATASYTPTMTMNATGAVVPIKRAEPTATINSMPSVYQSAAGLPPTRTTYEKPKREVSLSQRFMETCVYPLFAGMIIKDLATYFRQFATLIGAGIPIFQALSSMEKSTKNKKLVEVTSAALQRVQAGGRYSETLDEYPWIFSPVHTETLRAAEMGGDLETALRRVADYVEHQLEIRRLIQRETLYPIITLFIALMIFGKPGFSGDTLALVKLILNIGFGMGQPYGALAYFLDTIGFGCFVLLFFFVPFSIYRLFLYNKPGFRATRDTILLSIPVIGHITRQFTVARFGRTMAMLYRSGFGMSSALDIASRATGNGVLERICLKAAQATANGELASNALRSERFFSPMELDLLRTGEMSGQLDIMMDKMAEYNESEAKTKTHQAAIIFGVIIFLIVALFVASHIVSFYGGFGASRVNIGE